MTTYLIILAILTAMELAYFRIADRFNIIDKPNQRSSHKQITLRGGGIIFYFGALLYFIHSGGIYPWFFAGLTIVAVTSFTDDVHSLSPKLRLVLQILAMLLMTKDLGILSWNEIWLVAIVIFVCTGITNVYNFMDGINGITGGYSLVVLAALAYTNVKIVPQFIDQHLIYVTMIAVAVFCFFNFRKKAKCFAGDVGSVSIAFIIVFILCKLCLATKDVSWLMFLIVYGVDGVMTILHRIQLKEKLSEAHRKHAFQIMANELRIPHVVVSIIYMVLQAAACAWLIACPGYVTLICCGILLVAAYLIFMKKFYHLHEETLRKTITK